MTAPARNEVVHLVRYAQQHDDIELQARIEETFAVEYHELIHTLVLILVGMIGYGGEDTWHRVLEELALDDN